MKQIVKYIIIFLLAAACKKKIDFEYDNRPVKQPVANSGTRLINLVGAKQLQINGLKLTSFLAPDNEGYYGPGQIRLTSYFPDNGMLGLTYNIPSEFVNAQNIIPNVRLSSLSTRDFVPAERPFNLTNNVHTPFDYYYTLFAPNTGALQDSMFAIPRSVSPSSNPENFKIRIINLGSTPDNFHTGPVSLSYANGSIISGAENVLPGKYSDYIEMPFGTYQFKVLDASGKELPSKGNTAGGINVINPTTGTLMSTIGTAGFGGFSDTWLSYAPIKTYQPGGIYTIVVGATSGYSIPTGGPGETVGIVVNNFQVVADIAEPVNTTYARMQAINTLPGKQVKWLVDGHEIGSTAFAGQTNYSRFIIGTHTVKATDEQGVTLAEMRQPLYAGDNITLWLYAGKDAKPAISFSSNNLSGKFYSGTTGNDGSSASFQDVYPYWMRFMNFCSDLEEVTFTSNNGQLFGTEGSQHLKLGVAAANNTYVIQSINSATSVLAYASKPNVLPGDWLSTISPLKSTDFIANTNLYKTAYKPNSEPGIYTVALVGSTAAGATEKARMIIIKHNP
jgi:hypothetical protein